jgi:hypothetical protein
MSRDPRRARVLGLWTAGWLAAFLVAGMLWLGEPRMQWPVLAVPLLWALVALRPRRRPAWEQIRDVDDPEDPGWDDSWDDDAGVWPPEDRYPGVLPRPEDRTDTVERPAVRRPSRDDRWDG